MMASSWVTNTSDGIALAAGPLLVASETSSPELVAASVLLQRLPFVLFGLYAGVLADRLHRRRLLVVVNLLRVVVLVILATVIWSGEVNIAAVLVAMFLLGTAETFADTTFIVRSRIKTRPIRQWDVGREFQRRLKRNLQAAEIEMAVPGLPAHVTVASRHPGIAAAAMAATATPPDQEDAAAPEGEDAPSKG